MPWPSRCVICNGPSWASFFSMVQSRPPQVKPIMPMMIRMTPIIPTGFTPPMLQASPPANQLKNENDERNQKQNMNVCTENVETDKTKQPKNQQNNKDSPKHKNLSF